MGSLLWEKYSPSSMVYSHIIKYTAVHACHVLSWIQMQRKSAETRQPVYNSFTGCNGASVLLFSYSQ